MTIDRDTLGRIVREAWVKYRLEIGDNQPNHISSYDEISESDREVDRQIGEAVMRAVIEALDSFPVLRSPARNIEPDGD